MWAQTLFRQVPSVLLRKVDSHSYKIWKKYFSFYVAFRTLYLHEFPVNFTFSLCTYMCKKKTKVMHISIQRRLKHNEDEIFDTFLKMCNSNQIGPDLEDQITAYLHTEPRTSVFRQYVGRKAHTVYTKHKNWTVRHEIRLYDKNRSHSIFVVPTTQIRSYNTNSCVWHKIWLYYTNMVVWHKIWS
jgi:hypothetical protein